MSTNFRSASSESYFAASAVVSVVLAAIARQIPAIAFGTFLQMAAVLIAADVVLYLLMKLGVLKAPRDRTM